MSYSAEPKPVPVPRPKGILCPDCAVPMGVLETRGNVNILIRRRYRPQCGKRLSTQERPVTKAAAGSPQPR